MKRVDRRVNSLLTYGEKRLNKRKIGTNFERQAGKYLEDIGYEILTYNFRNRLGEVDIVAKHEGYLVFVEVKYRANRGMGDPLEAVTISKQKTICKMAMCYMKKEKLMDVPVRFDVVGITGEEFQVIQNAFEFIG